MRPILVGLAIQQFVAARAGCGDPAAWNDRSASIGVVEDGRVLAGVVFHDYIPAARWCEMSVAVDDPGAVTRRLLRHVFHYPFRQLRLRRLQAVTAKPEAARLLERLGFRREGTLRAYMNDGTDGEMFSMLPAECRWL